MCCIVWTHDQLEANCSTPMFRWLQPQGLVVFRKDCSPYHPDVAGLESTRDFYENRPNSWKALSEVRSTKLCISGDTYVIQFSSGELGPSWKASRTPTVSALLMCYQAFKQSLL